MKSGCDGGPPMIPEPEKGDPELRRTRLYPTWDDEELYGEDERFIVEDGRVQVREKRVDKLKRWIRWVAKAGRR